MSALRTVFATPMRRSTPVGALQSQGITRYYTAKTTRLGKGWPSATPLGNVVIFRVTDPAASIPAIGDTFDARHGSNRSDNGSWVVIPATSVEGRISLWEVVKAPAASAQKAVTATPAAPAAQTPASLFVGTLRRSERVAAQSYFGTPEAAAESVTADVRPVKAAAKAAAK